MRTLHIYAPTSFCLNIKNGNLVLNDKYYHVVNFIEKNKSNLRLETQIKKARRWAKKVKNKYDNICKQITQEEWIALHELDSTATEITAREQLIKSTEDFKRCDDDNSRFFFVTDTTPPPVISLANPILRDKALLLSFKPLPSFPDMSMKKLFISLEFDGVGEYLNDKSKKGIQLRRHLEVLATGYDGVVLLNGSKRQTLFFDSKLSQAPGGKRLRAEYSYFVLRKLFWEFDKTSLFDLTDEGVKTRDPYMGAFEKPTTDGLLRSAPGEETKFSEDIDSIKKAMSAINQGDIRARQKAYIEKSDGDYVYIGTKEMDAIMTPDPVEPPKTATAFETRKESPDLVSRLVTRAPPRAGAGGSDEPEP